MNQLWPRLTPGGGRQLLEEFIEGPYVAPKSATEHPLQTFAATGGSRVTPKTVGDLAAAVEEVARQHGYPDLSPSAQRIAFDRQAAEEIFDFMDVTAFEASQPGVWTFLAVVAMPGITRWRFGYENRERWIASDLTRHMFARLWWQAFTFGLPGDGGQVDYRLLRSLSESDLNQLTERRSIGGNHRLARAVAAELAAHPKRGRATIRHLARRLRRLTAFVDFAGVSDYDVQMLVRSAVQEAVDSHSAG